MTKREEKKLATRQRLLENAQKLLLKQGYSGLSVEDITKETGIAKGTFYNYFARKEDLLDELMRSQFRPLNHQIVSISQEKGMLIALQEYLLAYARIVEQMGVSQIQSWLQFTLASQNNCKWQLDVTVLTDTLDESQFQHSLLSNSALAEQIMTTMYGYIFLWASGGQSTLITNVKAYNMEYLPLLLKEK